MPCGKCDEAIYGVPVLKKSITNVGASIRQRLLNLARQRNEDFALVLTKYGLERLLFRISQSRHRHVFVLKGAFLFELWTEQRYRPTRDVDFLARGGKTPEQFRTMFKEICGVAVVEDGLRFDITSVKAERIREDVDYHGVRVIFTGHLENARIPVQIDIGFGDVITPPPQEAEFPTLLDLPAPKLLMYPKESVVAEKFEAMTRLGIANTRMKDLYDIGSLCRAFSFEGSILSEAILNTFNRRKTAVPAEKPLVFTPEFHQDENKRRQWDGFCNKNQAYAAEMSLKTICSELETFLMPVLEALRKNERLQDTWRPAGPWSDSR